MSKRWEYRVITSSHSDIDDVNSAGRCGWELVSVVSRGSDVVPRVYYYMRRQRSYMRDTLAWLQRKATGR
jgi:hypothetical protein